MPCLHQGITQASRLLITKKIPGCQADATAGNPEGMAGNMIPERHRPDRKFRERDNDTIASTVHIGTGCLIQSERTGEI